MSGALLSLSTDSSSAATSCPLDGLLQHFQETTKTIEELGKIIHSSPPTDDLFKKREKQTETLLTIAAKITAFQLCVIGSTTPEPLEKAYIEHLKAQASDCMTTLQELNERLGLDLDERLKTSDTICHLDSSAPQIRRVSDDPYRDLSIDALSREQAKQIQNLQKTIREIEKLDSTLKLKDLSIDDLLEESEKQAEILSETVIKIEQFAILPELYRECKLGPVEVVYMEHLRVQAWNRMTTLRELIDEMGKKCEEVGLGPLKEMDGHQMPPELRSRYYAITRMVPLSIPADFLTIKKQSLLLHLESDWSSYQVKERLQSFHTETVLKI